MALQNSFAKFFGANYPLEGAVVNTAPVYGDAINVLTPSLDCGGGGGGGTVPLASDVREGVAVGFGVGNLVLPAIADVLEGVTFGAGGTEFTGTLVQNMIPTPPAADMCRLKVQIALNGVGVDGATVTAAVAQANSIVNGNIDPSVVVKQNTTASGYTEMDLYRQVAFVRGSGEYLIEVQHNGKILASVKVAMPDQPEVFLTDLILISEPGYTGG